MNLEPETLNINHSPKRVLVTGGAGFIGSNFLLHMVPKNPETQFWNLDHLTYAGNLLNLSSIENAANYSFIQADITDLDVLNELFEQFDFTTVIHFAAESHVDRSILGPLVFAETNTIGTLKLLEAARRHWAKTSDLSSRRFYHVSTDEVYGTLVKKDSSLSKHPMIPDPLILLLKQRVTTL